MSKGRRILFHVVFWLISGLFLGAFIGANEEHAKFTWIFVALLLPVAACTSYAFNYYLFPSYLFSGQYLKFSIYGLFVFVLSIYMEAIIMVITFILIADYNVKNMPAIAANIPAVAISLYFIIFLSSVIHLLKKNKQKPIAVKPEVKPAFLQVRSNRQTIQLAVDQVCYIESLNDYVKIHTADKTIITKEKISKIKERLPDEFIRIHRSYIVNSSRIESFNKEKVKVKSTELPISRSYKGATMDSLRLV